MSTIAKPTTNHFRLQFPALPRLRWPNWRRRRNTMDLIHSSPHLLRDIGLLEEHYVERRP